MYEEFGEFQFVKLVDDINLEKINDWKPKKNRYRYQIYVVIVL